MTVHLSNRMQALAELVPQGARLVDVGTDHGFLPIYLVQTGKIPSAIAMDINKGPLERAREHIQRTGLDDRIQTRLSDGLQKLQADEADCCLIAGMGGGLVQKILKECDKNTLQTISYFVLQPQSEIAEVRLYLRENGLHIVEENMICEDGKYYPMMYVTRGSSCCSAQKGRRQAGPELTLEDHFGPILLKKGHPILVEWLEKTISHTDHILEDLRKRGQSEELNEKTAARIEELQKKLELLIQARERCAQTGV